MGNDEWLGSPPRGGPAEPVLDFESKTAKLDESGAALFSVQVVAMAEGGAEVISVKIAGEPKGIAQGATVKVTGLVATPWGSCEHWRWRRGSTA